MSMLSESERRTIGDILAKGSLVALCQDLSPGNQRRLVKWLQYKFRRCPDCGYPFPLTATNIKRCEPCRTASEKANNKKQYAENRQYYLDHSRRYKTANREQIRAQNREYKKTHPEIVRNNHRTYRRKHPDRVLAQVQSWQDRNRERVKAHGRAGYRRKIARLASTGQLEGWREEQRIKHRAYYAAHRDEIRARDKKLRALRKKQKAEPRSLLQWPYVTERSSESEILLAINGVIPKQIQGDLRADIGSMIGVAWVEDKTLIDALQRDPLKVKPFITAARNQNYEKGGYGAESLDTPMRDGRSWHDVLANGGDEEPEAA
jgi:hypothetical protein